MLDAFRLQWQEQGGTLVAAEPLAEPIELANQIADLLQVRSASRAQGSNEAPPTRRQDVDFLFLAATPQQAQQVKPTLVFQYAGDLPVYATSHLHAATNNRSQYLDLEGIASPKPPGCSTRNCRCDRTSSANGRRPRAALAASMPWALTPICWRLG